MTKSQSGTGPRRRERGSSRTIPMLAVGIVLVLVGGVAAALTVDEDSASGGADTPEAAVTAMFDAIGDEDLIGVLEALLPGERDAFVGPVRDLTRELRRLGILSDGVDLGGISGLDLGFTDLRYETDTISDEMALVRVVGGTATYSVDPRALPIGGFLEDLIGDEIDGAVRTSGSSEAADDELGLVTRKDGGHWYVSLWYTVAEGVRVAAGAPLPDPARRLAAVGAGSPGAAAEAMVRALLGFELRRVLELLPPDEARALHDYAPLFLDDLDGLEAEIRQGFLIEIGDITTDVDRNGSRAVVGLSLSRFKVEIPELDLSFLYEDGCVEVGEPGSSTSERVCPGDEGDYLSPFADLFGAEAPDLDLDVPQFGLVVVERDGAWFVSPTQTFFEAFTAFLRLFDRSDLEALRDFFSGNVPS